MKLIDIVEKLNLEVFSNKELLNQIEVKGAYISDLLSDVMGYANEKQIWITLQNHKNVLAVASLKDIAAIILVKGIKPGEEVLKHSEEEQIPMLGTQDQAFEISGKLYKLIFN